MSRINISVLSFLLVVSISLELKSEEEKLPVLGDASSSAISIASEYNLGRLYMAQLRRSLPEYLDPVTQDYTEHLVYRLSEYSELRDRRLEIALIDNHFLRLLYFAGNDIDISL